MEKNNSFTNQTDNANKSITLPVDREYFAEFISGLLGKPQAIEKSYGGHFVISYDDVINTHHLIEQRITNQNDANLIQFSVSINYDDSSTVHLNSLDNFSSFREVKPLICKSVTLTWIYLVKFRGKDVPEKQQIDLTFNAIEPFDKIVVLPITEGGGAQPVRLLRHGIKLRINHTERSWGNDIESLLDGHINTLVKEPRKINLWISSHINKIGTFLFSALSIGSASVAINVFEKIKNQKLEEFFSTYPNKGNSINVINDKLDVLKTFLFMGKPPVENGLLILIFFIASVILAGILSGWVVSKGRFLQPSFILLSQESKNQKEIYDNKHKRDWLMFLISIVSSPLLGILLNIAFAKYFSIL